MLAHSIPQSIRLFVILIGTLLIVPISAADDTDDIRALLDEYVRTESDLEKQAQMMTDDRSYIIGGARFTDNVANMKGQIAGQKLGRELDPDGMMIVTIEDPMIRINGDVAITTFYRHWNYIPGAAAVREGRDGGSPPSQVNTVIFERMGREWKIVHTHISPMAN
ncbi:MAG: ketosteroid isomerase-like protein [Woeseiaceae bacterium]|jgi:ketosteroid isomerase-like protein